MNMRMAMDAAECGMAPTRPGPRNSTIPNNCRYGALSTDGGESFSPASPIPELIEPGAGGCQGSIMLHGPSKRLLFSNPQSSDGGRNNGTLQYSSDAEHWQFLSTIEPGAFGYSSISYLPAAVTGGVNQTHIGILYEGSRSNDYVDIYLARVPVKTDDHTTLHVHPKTGSDTTGDGSATLPFLSVAGARDALRLYRRSTSNTEAGSATILLHQGTHRPFILDSTLDSGTADHPICYGAPPGAIAIVSGGEKVPASKWSAWGNHPHILTADLSALGLSNFGELPSAGGQIDACNALSGGKMQLFHEQKAMVLARYPNLAADGDWKFLHVSEGLRDGFTLASGANATRVLDWAKEEAPFLHGYWTFD